MPAASGPPDGGAASSLVKPGDSVSYGSYKIIQISDGIYQITDPGVTTGKGGDWGVDLYLVCGKSRALVIDTGNNYMDGSEKDLIAPRKNAAEEFRTLIYGLAGKRPLEITVTHAHPDHDGMTGALLNRKAVFWMPDGEDANAPREQHKVDPAIFTRFAPGKKLFDRGGERIVDTFPVRGRSNGGTVYLLKKDELRVYTGHYWQNVYGGFMSPNLDRVDVGYLDWRFVQNVASCAEGILRGKWLVEGSDLRLVGKMTNTDAWPSANGRAIMVYGIGAIILPLETA